MVTNTTTFAPPTPAAAPPLDRVAVALAAYPFAPRECDHCAEADAAVDRLRAQLATVTAERVRGALPDPRTLELFAAHHPETGLPGDLDPEWLREYAADIRALPAATAPDAGACKCTFAQHMVGDGCDVCNPELAAVYAALSAAPDAEGGAS